MFPELAHKLEPYDLVILIRTACRSYSDNEYEATDRAACAALRSMATRKLITIKTDESNVVWATGPDHRSLKSHAL